MICDVRLDPKRMCLVATIQDFDEGQSVRIQLGPEPAATIYEVTTNANAHLLGLTLDSIVYRPRTDVRRIFLPEGLNVRPGTELVIEVAHVPFTERSIVVCVHTRRPSSVAFEHSLVLAMMGPASAGEGDGREGEDEDEGRHDR